MQRACTGTGISDSLLMLGAVNLLIEGNLTAGGFFRKPIAVSPTHVSRMVPRAQEATELRLEDGSSAGGNENLTLVQRDARANPGSVEKASRRTGVDGKSCLCSRGAEVGSIVTEGKFHPFTPSTRQLLGSPAHTSHGTVTRWTTRSTPRAASILDAVRIWDGE